MCITCKWWWTWPKQSGRLVAHFDQLERLGNRVIKCLVANLLVTLVLNGTWTVTVDHWEPQPILLYIKNFTIDDGTQAIHQLHGLENVAGTAQRPRLGCSIRLHSNMSQFEVMRDFLPPPVVHQGYFYKASSNHCFLEDTHGNDRHPLLPMSRICIQALHVTTAIAAVATAYWLVELLECFCAYVTIRHAIRQDAKLVQPMGHVD